MLSWATGRGLFSTMRKREEKIVISGEHGDFDLRVDRDKLNDLFSITYEELRRMAASVRRGDPGATLNPTALVHEAWLKLAKSPAFVSTSRLHFKRVAARAMRQLLVESARRRRARKRGGEERIVVVLDNFASHAAAAEQDILNLDAALDELGKLNPRHALMVESRFFGGLDVLETAELLEVSEATVMRDWRVVKAWLSRQLRQ